MKEQDNPKIPIVRKTVSLSERYKDLGVSRHEGATICSMQFEVNGRLDEVSEKMRLHITELSQAVEASGGMVGHIKASLTEADRSTLISSTGEDIEVKSFSFPRVTVAFTAISFPKSEALYCAQIDAVRRKMLENKSD